MPSLREKRLLAVKDEMVARFKSELGYKSAKAGRDMYFMIHATDYLGAPALMQRAYAEAVQLVETVLHQDSLSSVETS